MNDSSQKIPGSLWGVYSVWARHATVFRRTWLVSVLPPITEAPLYLVSFGLGLGAIVPQLTLGSRPVSYMEFIAPAMIAVGICFQSFFEGAYGSFIRFRLQRTWNGLLTAPLGLPQLFYGELLWAMTRGVLAGTVTGIVTMLLGLVGPLQFLALVPYMFLCAAFFSAFGIMVAGVVKTIDQINVPVFLFILPMFTFSGTFFPRSNLPPAIGEVAGFLPLAQIVDLSRIPFAEHPMAWAKILALFVWITVCTAGAYYKIRPTVFR